MSESPSTPATHAEPVVEAAAPSLEPLFSAKQIAVATLCATPLAGAVLASSNARALGRGDGARALIVGAGALATATILGIDVWGAGPFTLLALPVSAAIALALAGAFFGGQVVRAGARGNAGVAVAVVACWLALGVVGAAAVGAMQLRAPSLDEALGDQVQHSPGERVHFTDGARREDAEEVARALVASGAFTGASPLVLSVDRPSPELLRVTVRVPGDASPADLNAGRAMVKGMTRHLTPPRCVAARLLTPAGDARASGTLCP